MWRPILPKRTFRVALAEEQSGSLAVLEAFRLGSPAWRRAARNTRGCADGHDGLLARPGDPRSLAEHLRALIIDPLLRRRLGFSGRETFRNRFSAPAFTRALDRVYQQLLAAMPIST